MSTSIVAIHGDATSSSNDPSNNLDKADAQRRRTRRGGVKRRTHLKVLKSQNLQLLAEVDELNAALAIVSDKMSFLKVEEDGLLFRLASVQHQLQALADGYFAHAHAKPDEDGQAAFAQQSKVGSHMNPAATCFVPATSTGYASAPAPFAAPVIVSTPVPVSAPSPVLDPVSVILPAIAPTSLNAVPAETAPCSSPLSPAPIQPLLVSPSTVPVHDLDHSKANNCQSEVFTTATPNSLPVSKRAHRRALARTRKAAAKAAYATAALKTTTEAADDASISNTSSAVSPPGSSTASSTASSVDPASPRVAVEAAVPLSNVPEMATVAVPKVAAAVAPKAASTVAALVVPVSLGVISSAAASTASSTTTPAASPKASTAMASAKFSTARVATPTMARSASANPSRLMSSKFASPTATSPTVRCPAVTSSPRLANRSPALLVAPTSRVPASRIRSPATKPGSPALLSVSALSLRKPLRNPLCSPVQRQASLPSASRNATTTVSSVTRRSPASRSPTARNSPLSKSTCRAASSRVAAAPTTTTTRSAVSRSAPPKLVTGKLAKPASLAIRTAVRSRSATTSPTSPITNDRIAQIRSRKGHVSSLEAAGVSRPRAAAKAAATASIDRAAASARPTLPIRSSSLPLVNSAAADASPEVVPCAQAKAPVVNPYAHFGSRGYDDDYTYGGTANAPDVGVPYF